MLLQGDAEGLIEALVLRYNLMFDDALTQPNPSQFVLYVEGPSDRDIIRIWARAVSHHLARAIDECVVILGGRQPARAIDHMSQLGGPEAGVRAVCVLDRDDHAGSRSDPVTSPGLELFVWPRRHIESYLLVPAAICRCAGVRPGDPHATRLIGEHLPPAGNDSAFAQVDAKRLLAARGPLANALGTPLSPARVARNMRAADLHPDVHDLLDRVRARLA